MDSKLQWLCAAGAVACLLAYASWLRAELAEAKAEAESYRLASESSDAAANALKAELAKRDAVLAERDKTLAEADKRSANLLDALKRMNRHDAKTAAWSDTPIPDAVRGLLSNETSSGHTKSRASSSTDAGRPVPAIRGKDQRRLAGVGAHAQNLSDKG